MPTRPARLGSLLTVLVLAAPAFADDVAAKKAEAEKHFAEGKKLMAAGSVAEACVEYEKSLAIDFGAGAYLSLGECYAAAGRFASARKIFLRSIDLAREKKRLDREKFAQEQLATVEPKVSWLTIKAGSLPAGASVAIDSDRLQSWDAPIPIDPGMHAISVTAPGKKSWSANVTIGALADRKDVVVPPLEDSAPTSPAGAASAPASPPAPTATAGGSTPAAAPVAPESSGSIRTVGLVLAGVGAAAAVGGVYFAVRASSFDAEARDLAAQGDPAASERTGDARAAQTFARVGLGVGVVGLIAGSVLFLTAPATKKVAGGDVRVSMSVGSTWTIGLASSF